MFFETAANLITGDSAVAPIGRGHGLRTVLAQVENGQSPVRKTEPAARIEPEALAVRPAQVHLLAHAQQRSGVHGGAVTVMDACKAAHQAPAERLAVAG